MKQLLLVAIILVTFFPAVRAQNTDLPSPVANLQTLPSYSYIIAMDNTYQVNSSALFNLPAYGLVVHLLNNNVKVKWIIAAGKSKDGIDFTVSSDRIKPTANATLVTRSFKAGPFVIFSSDTAGVAALIDAFYTANGLTGSRQPFVYRNSVPVTVDVRYDLTGFKPMGAVLNDGGNRAIHLAFMSAAAIPASNYTTITGQDLLSSCYTFASEPHNSKTGTTVNTAISNITTFVNNGGNFLAECAAIPNYENNALGRYQTSTGITVTNVNVGTSVLFPNPDLSYSQFEGVFNGSLTGSVENWKIISAAANNEHDHVTGAGANTANISASVAKVVSGKGGLVFYLGNHDYSTSDVQNINGIRMYMNAFLTPAFQVCPMTLLPLFLNSFAGSLQNGQAQLQWTVSQNQAVDYFTVEKSVDGIHYAAAGRVPAFPSADRQAYSFSEPAEFSGMVYYRVGMPAKSGETVYSQIVALKNDQPVAAGKIIALKNPVISTLSFDYVAAAAGIHEISIYSATGAKVFAASASARKGSNFLSFALNGGMPAGVYFLSMTNSRETITARFIKQ